MAKRTTAQFLALYGTAGSIFIDNTTGLISEEDMRNFATDISDTFLNTRDGIVASVSTTGGTITLAFNYQNERVFVGSASFATPKTIALSETDVSGTQVAARIEFDFTITNVAAVLTTPSTFRSSDIRWDGTGKTVTFGETGAYKIIATWDGTIWRMDISNPYV